VGSEDDFITQVIQLQNIQADKVLEVVTPLVDTERGSISASADVNAIILTDTAANIERIMEVVRGLDLPLTPVDIEVVNLQYAAATDVAEALNSMFGTGTDLPPEMLARMGIDPNAIQQGPGGFIGRAMQVKIVADERTNSIIISANESRMELIKQIIDQLDVNMTADVVYRVFKLEMADATQVAELLNQIFEQPQGGPGGGGGGGMFGPRIFFGGRFGRQQEESFHGLKENVVVADVRTNSVIVTAAQENMVVFEDMIEQLDKVQPLTDLTKVYELENAQAEELSQVLSQAFQGQGNQFGGFLSFIFGGRGQAGGPLEQLQDITVTAEAKSNSLIVTAPPQAFDLVEEIIEKLDQPQKQVYISVIIADVTLTDDLQYGVEWNWFTRSDPSFTGSSNMGLDEWDEGIRWGVLSDTIQGFLEALERETEIRVMSTPSILTLDNVQGTISSGREITVRTGTRELSSGSIIDETAREEAAIVLNVTPRINDSGFVQLDIDQTIDDLGELDSFGNPTFVRRQATATVLVRAGETVVLGGVIQEDRRVTKREVPVLKEIPLIGELFESTEETVRRSELMVFITPYVMEDEIQARELRIREQNKLRTDLESEFPYELSTDPEVRPMMPPGDEPEEPVVPEPDPQPVSMPDPVAAPEDDLTDDPPYRPGSRGGRRW
jgi:general secretion pathway protein D